MYLFFDISSAQSCSSYFYLPLTLDIIPLLPLFMTIISLLVLSLPYMKINIFEKFLLLISHHIFIFHSDKFLFFCFSLFKYLHFLSNSNSLFIYFFHSLSLLVFFFVILSLFLSLLFCITVSHFMILLGLI